MCYNPILSYSPNLLKNKKKLNKRGWCRQKNQDGNFGHFRELDRTSFVPRNEGKCIFKATVIYYQINMRKN